MDAISAVAFELAAPAASSAGAGSASAAAASSSAQAAPAVFDMAHFSNLYSAAATQPAAEAHRVSASEQGGFRSVLATLDNLNGHADAMGADAMKMQANASEMRPGDMLMMTMKAQEFLFHCELTSNVANRTSEGVQQLFREQS